jgi:hypothetical protein
MKIRRVELDLFHADRRMDGQTGMTKLIASFRNSANSPKNCSFIVSNLHVVFHFLSYSIPLIFPRISGIADRSIA